MDRILLIATSYSGKTFAHREGTVEDVEERPTYKTWKQGWGDAKKANDPAWRLQQRAAYVKERADAIAGPAAIVTIHPPKGETGVVDATRALDAGDRRIMVFVPDEAGIARAEQIMLEETQEGKAHAASRKASFERGLLAVRELAANGVPALRGPDIATALKRRK